MFTMFLFCLDLELFLLRTEDLNKIKNPGHPFVDVVKYETFAKFQQKVLNSMVLEQVFNFSDNNLVSRK